MTISKNVGNIWEELVITAPISTETTAGTARIATQAEVDSGVTVGDEPAFVSVEGLRHSAEVTPPYHNYINNPAFQLWTKGESFSGINTHASDCWTTYSRGGSQTALRIAQASNTGSGIGSPYFIRLITVGGATTGDYGQLYTHCEDVRRFSNRKLSLIVRVRSNNSSKIAVKVGQHFGTGGTPSSVVTAFDEVIQTTPISTNYIFTFTTSSTDGKVLGTNNNSTLGVLLFTSSLEVGNKIGVQSDTFNIEFVGLYDGDVVLPIVVPDISETTNRCERYIQVFTKHMLSYNNGIGSGILSVYLRRPMFSIPSVTSSAAIGSPQNYVYYASLSSDTVLAFNCPNLGAGIFYLDYIRAEANI